MFKKIKEKSIKFLFGMLKMELIIVSISIIGIGTLEVVYLLFYGILDLILGVVITSSNIKFISNIFLLLYMISKLLMYITGGEILYYYFKILIYIILIIITVILMVIEMNYYEERGWRDMIGKIYYYLFIIIGYIVLKYDNYNFWVGDDDKMANNFKNRHERIKKELEINKLFRLLGLKWLIVILITTITGNDLYYLETIIVLIIIYDFYITITKKRIIFKKIVDMILIMISILNIILFIIYQNSEIKLLFLIVSIIVEFTLMLRELKLYNKVKNL